MTRRRRTGLGGEAVADAWNSTASAAPYADGSAGAEIAGHLHPKARVVGRAAGR